MLLESTQAAWAGKFLDQWCTNVMRYKKEPLKGKAKILRKHKPIILNWFKAKGEHLSGVVKGLNLKAKLTARKSYGFRSPEMLPLWGTRFFHLCLRGQVL
jgi:transposase